MRTNLAPIEILFYVFRVDKFNLGHVSLGVGIRDERSNWFDDLWHQHILFTQDYHAMCQSTCDRYIHHQPFVGNVKVDPNARVEMRALYLREFGEQPNAMWSVDGLCSPNPNCEGKS